jgi:tripartite-type tricarboxylate transporter receptor subunit TctC
VPTFAEQGLANVHGESVFGVFASPVTPADTVLAVNRAIGLALGDTPWRQRFEAAGCQVLGGSPEAFAARVRREAQAVRQVMASGQALLT